VGKLQKLIQLVLSGQSDGNIGFNELCNLLIRCGFEFRVRGSHHVFWKHGVNEIINLQAKSGKAKAYQVKQVRDLLVKYRLTVESEQDE
jgi:predicted RNA binding protein YcfA (HicA-like mRNA interferase family)